MAPGCRYLVTGANGQDGGYLIERLVAEGHVVHGMCRDGDGAARLAASAPAATAHVADLEDGEALDGLVASVRPTHIVNLAGKTSVAWSWESPAEAASLLGVGAARLLDAAWHQTRSGAPVRVLQASSAEMFGLATEVPQNETTRIAPISPYGAAKAYAHMMTGIYRDRGLYASTAILYNHESPRRPETFVTRKIVTGVVRIARGLDDKLILGNIDAVRDWGYAPDYVEAMIHIMEQPEGGDYIVATGAAHTVRDFVAAAFAAVGIEDWARYVVIDRDLYRPTDPQSLVGDPSKLIASGWKASVDFPTLVKNLVAAEIDIAAP